MARERMKLVGLAAVLGALALGACGGSTSPGNPTAGTSVKVALHYDDSLGLDSAEVILGGKPPEAGPIEHELLLLLPDDLAGMPTTITIWGDKGPRRAAFGTLTLTPKVGKTVAASATLMACMPSCVAGQLTTCVIPDGTCPLGCNDPNDASDARCAGPTPSNGVPQTYAGGLSGTTTISTNTVMDTDTGAITGAFTRAAGMGIDATTGIAYYPLDPAMSGGAPLGVFAFNNLTINAAVSVRLKGMRAAVILIADTGQINGTIDVSANLDFPGPGGGAGGDSSTSAQGCGPGGAGGSKSPSDGGGGGGGGYSDGGPGGVGGSGGTQAASGSVGMKCLPDLLDPLGGGGGGGRGGPGAAASAPSGGAGGGALQITALNQLTVAGIINAGGGGGGSGMEEAAFDVGGGGGGGAGGAILLEAPAVTVSNTAILAANGGGGGGGGGGTITTAGDNGGANLGDPAPMGGDGGDGNNNGGTGGAIGPPDVGRDGAVDGGGGGGGFGRIVVRGATRVLAPGRSSPSLFETTLNGSPAPREPAS